MRKKNFQISNSKKEIRFKYAFFIYKVTRKSVSISKINENEVIRRI